MTRYTTIQGDVLDAIAKEQLGSEADVTRILDINPGLAELPFILPAGLSIELPTVEPETTPKTIRLWGAA